MACVDAIVLPCLLYTICEWILGQIERKEVAIYDVIVAECYHKNLSQKHHADSGKRKNIKRRLIRQIWFYMCNMNYPLCFSNMKESVSAFVKAHENSLYGPHTNTVLIPNFVYQSIDSTTDFTLRIPFVFGTKFLISWCKTWQTLQTNDNCSKNRITGNFLHKISSYLDTLGDVNAFNVATLKDAITFDVNDILDRDEKTYEGFVQAYIATYEGLLPPLLEFVEANVKHMQEQQGPQFHFHYRD